MLDLNLRITNILDGGIDIDSFCQRKGGHNERQLKQFQWRRTESKVKIGLEITTKKFREPLETNKIFVIHHNCEKYIARFFAIYSITSRTREK